MSRVRSSALAALLALGVLGLWGPSAAAQYVGRGTAYAQGYYYTPGQGFYSSGYYYSPRPAAGFYYYPAPGPSLRSWVVVPGGPSRRNYPGRPVPSRNFGLEPESLPAQVAEGIGPAPVAPGPGATWRTDWWRGRAWSPMPRGW